MGSGTTMAAAQVLDRVGYGCEISPAYCDVVLRRMMNLKVGEGVLVATGQSFAEVATERGVSDDASNPRGLDSRAIKHKKNGAPYYGKRRARWRQKARKNGALLSRRFRA